MNELVHASFQEAERLGHSWVGQEHLLLALVKDSSQSRAREALLACGLNETVISDRVQNMTYEPEPPPLAPGERLTPNPHYYTLWGRAEGLSIAAGSESPAEYLLLAMIWDETSVLGAVLRTVGRSSADLQTALAGVGVRVPDIAPPVE